MGFFSNYSNIGKINTLVDRLVPHLDFLASAVQNPGSADSSKVKAECGAVSILMEEISDIASNSSFGVQSCSYFLDGRKMSLMEISRTAVAFIRLAEQIYL